MNTEVFPPYKFTVNTSILAFTLLLGIGSLLYFPMVDNYYFADELDPIIASQLLHDRIQQGQGSILEIFRSDYIKIPERYNTHFRPMGYLNAYLIYIIFGTSNVYLNILAVLAHLANITMVYLILKKLLQNDIWALLAALIFTVDGIGSDAVFFIGAAQLYYPESVPHYLCLLGFVYYIVDKKPVYIIVSYIGAAIALFGNEFAWQLLPTILAISYFWEKQKSWAFLFKSKFIPYYLFFTGYIILARACLVKRPTMETGGMQIYIDNRLSGKLLQATFVETGKIFHQVPVLKQILGGVPEFLLGMLLFAAVILIIVISWVKIKDFRFRFLVLWFVFSMAIVLPIGILPRYLYHPAVPFWTMVIFAAAAFLTYLRNKKPDLSRVWRNIAIVLFAFLLVFHITLNHQRENFWDRYGDFELSRVTKILREAGNPAVIKKLYFLNESSVPGNVYRGNSRELSQHMMVYMDNPYISWTIFEDHSLADSLQLQPGDYLIGFNGRDFDVIRSGDVPANPNAW